MLQHGKRPTIASRHGMVAAAHPLAAAAGARILANGGNAFDAAAATAAALNVVEPYMSGLAGRMGLATCYIARGTARAHARLRGARSRASSRSTSSTTANSSCAGRSPSARRAISPAGASWCSAYGTQEAARAVRARDRARARRLPADRVQRRGVQRRGAELSRPRDAASADWSRNYIDGTERRHAGRVLKQPDLARTLEAIAAEGPQSALWRRARPEDGRPPQRDSAAA